MVTKPRVTKIHSHKQQSSAAATRILGRVPAAGGCEEDGAEAQDGRRNRRGDEQRGEQGGRVQSVQQGE